VRRRLEMSSLNTKATITGSYDALLIEAISQRWFDLLDERANSLAGGAGQVVLHFKLHSDGSVTELSIAQNSTPSSVLGWLCYEAVHDISTPVFQPWPDEMKHVETDPRQITFTFNYINSRNYWLLTTQEQHGIHRLYIARPDFGGRVGLHCRAGRCIAVAQGRAVGNRNGRAIMPDAGRRGAVAARLRAKAFAIGAIGS